MMECRIYTSMSINSFNNPFGSIQMCMHRKSYNRIQQLLNNVKFAKVITIQVEKRFQIHLRYCSVWQAVPYSNE